MTTESDFDKEYDVEELAQSIVDWHKKDLKENGKNKTRRHNQ
jgi:hypothetical protein